MKKGAAPAPVQKPIFVHPAANSALLTILERLLDLVGISTNFSYSLTSILFIINFTMLCGAEDWEEMSALPTGMQEWLSQYSAKGHFFHKNTPFEIDASRSWPAVPAKVDR